MQPSSAQDYKQLLTEVIKKQIVILGPDITLSKARNVKGLTVANDGTVTDVQGSPQEVTQALIDQFVQLSGLIVKKTMEPLLTMSQSTQQPTPSTQPPVPQTNQPKTTTPTMPATPSSPQPPIQTAQAAIDTAAIQPTAPSPQQSSVSPIQPTTTPVQPISSTNTQEPANNPLAA